MAEGHLGVFPESKFVTEDFNKCDGNNVTYETIPNLLEYFNHRKFNVPIFGSCKLTPTIFWTLYGCATVGTVFMIVVELLELCRDGFTYFNFSINSLDWLTILCNGLCLITIWCKKDMAIWCGSTSVLLSWILLSKGPLILLCQMISVECSTNFEFGATFSIEV